MHVFLRSSAAIPETFLTLRHSQVLQLYVNEQRNVTKALGNAAQVIYMWGKMCYQTCEYFSAQHRLVFKDCFAMIK